MKQQTIRRIFRHQYKKLLTCLQAMHPGYTPEAVHTFRVQVKKFRASLHLLSAARPGHRPYKLPKKLKAAYTIAGRIRTYQLQATMINAQQGLSDYAADIDAHVLRLQAIAAMQTYSVKKLKHAFTQLEKRLPHKVSGRDMERFFKKCLQPLQNDPVAPYAIHPLRQGLKDLQYNLAAFEHDLPAYRGPASAINAATLSTYTDLIGQYLDSHVYLQLIHSDRNIYPPAGTTRQRLQQLEKHWLTVQRQLYRQLMDTLPGLGKAVANEQPPATTDAQPPAASQQLI
ncbi:hypothetical protein DCC81_10000 [Chitinophaga parva]|uniref:CHAD domain-containing protein n=1 Tax=Chitinophaga parva TaxID=2169414 RepID=A0A2T7BPZ0_9BACT|nr:CHAD domain-containing protein [Chitinophaga parva]PUZ29747.1 hypothetical protein DCC81_10000 [Chitinophaga parva]